MIDLLSERVGGRIVDCNDEFFAEAENLIAISDPVWREGEYTDRGKWMDGWETRRRREPGHDWCVLELGVPGRVQRVTIDTSFFTGNYPEQFSLDAAGGGTEWVELIPPTDLSGDSVAHFDVVDPHRVERVRLNIFPDGGVARLRLEGEPLPGRDLVCPEGLADLVSMRVGGEIVDASDLHYSHPASCLRPTPSAGMWDGWETKRRRDDGHDWIVVRLGLPGAVARLVADTRHFKGNAPGWISAELSPDGSTWRKVVDRAAVEADTENEIEIGDTSLSSHLRFSIHPDGGLARLRVLGRADADAAGESGLEYVNSLFDEEARLFFTTACGSTRWVEGMVGHRAFSSTGELLDCAERCFDDLGSDDWLEAFASHPRIGERGDVVASSEQAGAAGHEAELTTVNTAYEEKFGFIYIVYATGKSGEEMLEIARRRMGNDRKTEIATAAAEQRRITATRLRQMMCQKDS